MGDIYGGEVIANSAVDDDRVSIELHLLSLFYFIICLLNLEDDIILF